MRSALAVLVVIFAGCSIHHASDQFACTTTVVVDEIRTCSDGFCVVKGTVTIDAPMVHPDSQGGDARRTPARPGVPPATSPPRPARSTVLSRAAPMRSTAPPATSATFSARVMGRARTASIARLRRRATCNARGPIHAAPCSAAPARADVDCYRLRIVSWRVVWALVCV